MPPYANDEIKPSSSSSLLSDDDSYTGRLGCIEIEFKQEKGSLKPNIIITLPKDEQSITLQQERVAVRKEATVVQEEKEYSIMDDITSTIDSWLGCQCEGGQPLKSALRHTSSGKYEHPEIDRNVSFTNIEIREFKMTLGDHPSAVSGPPVMLDWASQPKERVVEINQYEQSRGPRRHRRNLKLSFDARRGILEREQGFTVDEVKEAWREALKIRKQRQETRNRSPTMNMVDEAWESACRKTQRLADTFYDVLMMPLHVGEGANTQPTNAATIKGCHTF